METLRFSLLNLEVFLLLLVRVVSMLALSPIFGMKNVPMRVKIILSVCISAMLMNVVPIPTLEYTQLIVYGLLVIKEIVVGIIIGFAAYCATVIISFAGDIIDQQIGFSMVSIYDPMSQLQVSVTSNLYYYLFLLTMLATNMHYFIITALIDSFTLIPLGGASINTSIYKDFIGFATDYMLIGFRISLPIVAVVLVMDAIMAILAKTTPQINMMVVGLPLKALVGLAVLLVTIGLISTISDFIFEEMLEMMYKMIRGLSP